MALEPSNETQAALLTLLSILTTIGIPITGYVLTNLHKNIKAVADGAEKRDVANTGAIVAAEARMKDSIEAAERRATAYIHDVEARNVKRVEDGEARAEKGDERILALVNSQYSDLRGQLQNISSDVKTLTREGCGALAQCKQLGGD